jgi:hypothetical protein
VSFWRDKESMTERAKNGFFRKINLEKLYIEKTKTRALQLATLMRMESKFGKKEWKIGDKIGFI